jgi:LacI family transcriptional regulator
MKKTTAADPSAPNATIRDVARKAGVCIGTVSRVINNKDRVDPETRERIQTLIKEMGYQPSALGRNLALRRTHAIQLSVFNIADPYCAQLLKDITRHCREHHYGTLLSDADYDPALEAEGLRRLLDGRVDGAIVTPVPATQNAPHFKRLIAAGFPLVLMDNRVLGVKAHCVKYDDAGGTRTAMEYLFGKGHQRIGFFGCHLHFNTVRDRYEAFAKCHREREIVGWESRSLAQEGGPASGQVAGRLAELLRTPIPLTAILAENELMATTCIHALHALGKRVPQDVAVLSFGGATSPALAPMPLTSVSLHPEKAAEEAVHLLLDLIEHLEHRKAPAQTVMVKPELVLGESA